ncbi:MAG: hypothetical protein JWR59_1104 [Brevundimonas sp.]|nr:hypothetical protein [Brevundimonas sp.]
MAFPDLDAEGYDPQDQAEAFDETHNTDELGYPDETRSFEPDLFEDTYDATSAQGDADEDDVALDASDYDPEDLDDEDTDEEEGHPLYLDDDLEDEDDDLEEDDLLTEPSLQAASDDEADLEFTDNVDDAGRTSDRMARRYESPGELSQADVRSLGYGNDDKKETGMADDKAKGSGATAEDVEDQSHPHQEELLDEGVEETFPASDPVSVKHIT